MVVRGIPLSIIFFYQLCLNSAQKPVLKVTPKSPVYAAVNTHLVLTCSVVDSNKTISLRWASLTNEVNSTGINRNLSSVTVFHRLKYTDEGVYNCQAINQTSGLVIAESNVTVKVGDPPPKPPSPTITRVCGYEPLWEVIVSYNYTSPSFTSTLYPVIVELIICPILDSFCVTVCDDFKVVKGSRRVVHQPKNYAFQVNAADTIKEMVPGFPVCKSESPIDCATLCFCVLSRNAFGITFSQTLIKRIQENIGKVANFRALKVGRNSITLAWDLPRCLRNHTRKDRDLYYWIWCESSLCGNKIMIKSSVNVISGLNYTIKSLREYTKYTIYASSSFFTDFLEPGDSVSITVQTKEGVPMAAPVIEILTWLSGCTESNGTAMLSWKVHDKSTLLGELRQYVITYSTADNLLTITRNVSADKQRLVISELQISTNYEFDVKVCTGGGCSEASSSRNLSSIDCTSSDSSPDRLNGFPWFWMSFGVIAFMVLASTILCYVIVKQKRNGRVDLRPGLPPDDEINPTAHGFDHQLEPDSDYACANGQFSSHTDQEILANGPQDLQRTPSVETCSTDI